MTWINTVIAIWINTVRTIWTNTVETNWQVFAIAALSFFVQWQARTTFGNKCRPKTFAQIVTKALGEGYLTAAKEEM